MICNRWFVLNSNLYINFVLGSDIIFVYPDFKTALYGTFVNDTLIDGKPTKITSYRCKNGLMEIKVAKPADSAPSFTLFEPNTIRISNLVKLIII